MQDIDAVHAGDEEHRDGNDSDLICSDGESDRRTVVRRARRGVEKFKLSKVGGSSQIVSRNRMMYSVTVNKNKLTWTLLRSGWDGERATSLRRSDGAL